MSLEILDEFRDESRTQTFNSNGCPLTFLETRRSIMPTYDYRCEACEHEWELFQSIKAEPEKKCPACKKKKARRLIGAGAGLIFKGTGFYLTDYRSKSYKDAAKADKSASESATSKPDSGSKSDGSSAKPSSGEGSKSKD